MPGIEKGRQTGLLNRVGRSSDRGGARKREGEADRSTEQGREKFGQGRCQEERRRGRPGLLNRVGRSSDRGGARKREGEADRSTEQGREKFGQGRCQEERRRGRPVY